MNTGHGEVKNLDQLRTQADVTKDHLKSGISETIDKTSQTVNNLKNNIKTDIAELIKIGKASGKAGLSAAADQLNEYVEKIYESAIDVGERGKLTAQSALKKTDVYVRANPWRSTAVAAGAGIVIGAILNYLARRD